MSNFINELLQFIFSNIFILVIIGGFILNFFKKVREATSEQNSAPRPQQRKEYERRNEPSLEQMKEINVESHPQMRKNTTENNFNTQANDLLAKYQQLQQEPMFTEEKKPQVLAPKRMKKVKELPSYSKNKAVQGIIWSEVLGPPRSKKPLFRK
ncbi:hypothetical protein LCL95_12255 [Bacillus timonensis]|nr:hypothetical protein [Bacillus timonensis]